MRAVKLIVCAVLLIGLAGAWYLSVSARAETKARYNAYIAVAEESRGKGLYEQAVENFKRAAEIKNDPELWRKIRDTYEEYGASVKSAKVKNAYVEDMLAAAAAHRKEPAFYLAALLLQMDGGDYREAKRTADSALKNGATNDEILAIASQLTYMTKLDYKAWRAFSSAGNGYCAVSDGSAWLIIGDDGEERSDRYAYVGLVNAQGGAAVKTELGFRLIDGGGVERAILPDDIEAAGLYDDDTGLLPLLVGGKWQYFNLRDALSPAKYDRAGAYAEGEAAVSTGGKWFLIDAGGNVVTELPFEDLRLSPGGSHARSGVIVAKQDGKWHLFDEEKLSQIGDLSAEDVDLFLDGYIAFGNGGKWGFADSEGKVVKEPEYAEAKSFSNGLAAVKNEAGLWGFVNGDFETVIPHGYLDADYFNAGRTCFVSEEEGQYRRLGFVFD
jgi:tetratricopeptide (TPR) repeat protein